MERTKRRLTLRQVGEQIGATSMAVSLTEDIKKTRISTKTDFVTKLCELYGLNPDKIKKQIMAQKYAESVEKLKTEAVK